MLTVFFLQIVFLLVENYNYLTAPVGLRIGWEFLNV